MVEFLDLREDLKPIDLPLEGGNYTWLADTHTTASK